MARNIRRIKASNIKQLERKKVAAYVRVSSGKDAMLHSLSAQISYYNDYIQKRPEWEFVGIYADEGMTGTKDNRKEFQRMLQDARDRKIDLIITKSISRFARNTVTMLTILASFAQEESKVMGKYIGPAVPIQDMEKITATQGKYQRRFYLRLQVRY